MTNHQFIVRRNIEFNLGWGEGIPVDGDGLALGYARLKLDAHGHHVQSNPSVGYGVVCLRGVAVVYADGRCFELRKDDSAVLPAGVSFEVECDTLPCDLAFFLIPRAPWQNVDYIPYAQVREEEGQCVRGGEDGSGDVSTTYILAGEKNDEGILFRLGMTIGAPERWPTFKGMAAEDQGPAILLPSDMGDDYLTVAIPQNREEGSTGCVLMADGDALFLPAPSDAVITAPSPDGTLFWCSAYTCPTISSPPA